MKKFILTSIISLFALTTVATPAFADVTDSSTAKGFGSELQIDAKATTVNVTVPTTAPMVFNADGTATLPSDCTIQNNSKIGGVYLDSISLDARDFGWKLLQESADLKLQAKDLKKIKLKIGKSGHEKLIAPTNATEDSTGAADFNSGDIDIAASSSETLNFIVERGTFTQDVPNATAFNMTLKFEFK